MNRLADDIATTKPAPGAFALFFLGQAGFVLKTAEGKVIYVDPYFSDACNRMFGFKRIIPPPIAADDVVVDLFITTHDHADHLDPDSVPTIVKNNPHAVFAGPVECVEAFQKLAPRTPPVLLKPNLEFTPFPGVKVAGVPCDHGELAPNALGIILEIAGRRVYFLGDTCYREDIFQAAAARPVDVLIPPINGKFGNLDSTQAARCVSLIRPTLAIPCHFWMFIQHNGDPGAFVAACDELKVPSRVLVMAVGEKIIFPK